MRAMIRRRILPTIALLVCSPCGYSLGQPRYVEYTRRPGSFPISSGGALAPISVDPSDYPGVVRAAGDLKTDIERVTGSAPPLALDSKVSGRYLIMIGTVGRSALIDGLISQKKLNVEGIRGKWECFVMQVVKHPTPSVEAALVIAGSDKRGTIYGIYDLSEQIGVSPWYWWADVPVPHHDALFVKEGRYEEDEPAVNYRGIFLNDEAPSLSGWVHEKFGGYNHQFYVKVFELILRLKGNYLWPAMWGSAFNEDDPLNPKLADEYGIVMGTSHHEPMLRAQQEWKRHGKGPWDYSKNGEFLRNFWTQGIERNKDYESIVTIGMRGDGDMPMSQSANIELLEKIVADQRKILVDHLNPNIAAVPQDWALYKEVQEYYEKGMRAPDDVTLLWCDDNWGNIRRLPTPDERKRAGGAGVYYHFDYVGDPRNYKWINTVPITKVWEQMNLALNYGATRIWIVNVGDLKPMEFPIEFFLDFARDPSKWPNGRIGEFTRLWAAREFGPEHASEIAGIISQYTKFNGRRKPELLEPGTYSLIDYSEADNVLADFRALVAKAERISRELAPAASDAFFELALFPAKAAAIVNELYIAAGKNRIYAAQGRASANDFAAQTRALFKADSDLSAEYNHRLANGKWDHMMDQTHIGYTYWQQPPVNTMPEVKELSIPENAAMGVAVEGSATAWPSETASLALPDLDVFNQGQRWIDVFNRGRSPFEFTATPDAPWITLSETRGRIEKEKRIQVGVNWAQAPSGWSGGAIRISQQGGESASVKLRAFRPLTPSRASLDGFVEANGFVSIEAEHFTRNIATPAACWEKIDDYGRTLSSMTLFPVTAQSATPPASPYLQYKMYLFDKGTAKVEAILAPTLNFVPGRGLRFGISFDDEPVQVIDALADNSQAAWETSVRDSVRYASSSHLIREPGYHTLKFWMVDPGVVLQKLVVDFGGVRPSYLGPPESYHRIARHGT